MCRTWPLMLLIAIAVAATVVGRLERHPSARPWLPQVGAAQPTLVAGTPAAYRYLAQRGTNRCGLQPQQLQGLPEGKRLQGPCCSRLDGRSYREQVQGLRRFAGYPEIPKDPYDIQVRLAKRLVAYGKSIKLPAGDQATYDHAMAMSDEKGPCCCHCWRWDAFAGLSKHLIADRRWNSRQVAKLIGLLDGCGGSDSAHGPGPRMPAMGG